MKFFNTTLLILFYFVTSDGQNSSQDESQIKLGHKLDGSGIPIGLEIEDIFDSIPNFLGMGSLFDFDNDMGNIKALKNDKMGNEDEPEVYRESYTVFDGRNTFQVTEIHVGRKGRNLNKPREGIPVPMMLFQNIDSVFDMMFNDLAQGLLLPMGLGEDEDHHQDNIEADPNENIEIDEEDLKLDNEDEEDSVNSEDEEKTLIENEQFKEDLRKTKKSEPISEGIEVPKVKLTPEKEEKSEDLKIKGRSVQEILMNKTKKTKPEKDNKKKETLARICKYVFYSIIIFCIFIFLRKLLQIAGISEEQKLNPTHQQSELIDTRNSDVKKE